VVIEGGVAPSAGPGARSTRGGRGDDEDLARLGVAAGRPGQDGREPVEQGLGQALGPAGDHLRTAVLDRAFQKADDAVRAGEEVLGIRPPASASVGH
jgi:hypothetical protein